MLATRLTTLLAPKTSELNRAGDRDLLLLSLIDRFERGATDHQIASDACEFIGLARNAQEGHLEPHE